MWENPDVIRGGYVVAPWSGHRGLRGPTAGGGVDNELLFVAGRPRAQAIFQPSLVLHQVRVVLRSARGPGTVV